MKVAKKNWFLPRGFTLLAALAALAPVSRAADHFLAIGGGDSPSNNQISLEKNVLFFERLLNESAGSAAADVLFSDGSAGSRDVQFTAADEPPRVNQLLARLFGDEDDLYEDYRPHQLPGLRGPSTRKGLQDWLATTGRKLGDGDRLLIYFTGHGSGSGGGKTTTDTTLSLWGEKPMHVTEFTAWLDQLSPKVQVVLVMVQCHAGGFAGTIFKDGKGGELSPARRCGFFATTFERLAAGCTPDTSEDDYKDYSTYFFAALGGKSRGGRPVTGCDLDGDGRVSFAEAHAYVVVHSDTVDIPTTASEALLRRFSKSSRENAGNVPPSFADLLEKASLPQKSVLEGLSRQLKLGGEDRLDEVKRLAELLEAQRKTSERDQKKKREEAEKLGQRIRERISRQWPELSNPWHPHVPELLRTQGARIQQAIEMDSDCPRWELLRRDVEQLGDHELDLQRQWVKCQRLARALETVALAANLEKSATPEVFVRYQQMLGDEAGLLPAHADAK